MASSGRNRFPAHFRAYFPLGTFFAPVFCGRQSPQKNWSPPRIRILDPSSRGLCSPHRKQDMVRPPLADAGYLLPALLER